jgi:hypothetical protein
LAAVVLRLLRVVLRLLGRWCLRRVVALAVRRLLVVMGHPAVVMALLTASAVVAVAAVLVGRGEIGS